MERNFLRKSLIETTKRAELIEYAIYGVVLVLLTLVMPLVVRTLPPGNFVVQNNQFIVGPAVNAALILAALNLRGAVRLSSIVLLPSVTAISLGVFAFVGNVFMLYIVPAIWAGNAVLVLCFKYLYVHRQLNYIFVAAVAVMGKAAVIFLTYNILVWSGVIMMGGPVDTVMSSMMGLTQVITATAGAVIAYGIVRLRGRLQ